jgi:hypothetical protein
MESAFEAQITAKKGSSCTGGNPHQPRPKRPCMAGTASVFDRMLMSGQA